MNQFISPRSKLFGHLSTLDAIKRGLRPPPVNVEIDLSNRCDLKCAHCHFAYTHTRGPWVGHADKPSDAVSGGDVMDYALAKRILKELAAAGVKSVVWTGGGEPTLHRQFDDIIEYAYSVGLQQGIYTHGGWIDEERAENMKRDFEWVYFSLDAHDAQSYKEYKGVNRFDKVISNIRGIVEAPGKATIGIGFLLNRDNHNRTRAMVALGRSLGVDYVQFRPTILYAQDAPGELAEDTRWIDWAVGWLNEFAGDPFVVADVERFRRYQRWNGHGYPVCNWAALQTVITPNGKVWRCTNKREHPDALLGDLSIESFATVWERGGGPCAVDLTCRIACRGDIPNQTLDAVLAPSVHANFI